MFMISTFTISNATVIPILSVSTFGSGSPDAGFGVVVDAMACFTASDSNTSLNSFTPILLMMRNIENASFDCNFLNS